MLCLVGGVEGGGGVRGGGCGVGYDMCGLTADKSGKADLRFPFAVALMLAEM